MSNIFHSPVNTETEKEQVIIFVCIHSLGYYLNTEWRSVVYGEIFFKIGIWGFAEYLHKFYKKWVHIAQLIRHDKEKI